MRRFSGRILAMLSIVVLASAFAFSAIAVAQEEYPPPTTDPGSLTVPGTVQVGGEVAVSGQGCLPNDLVRIAFNGIPVTTAMTDANGRFATSFPLPPGTTPGVYTIQAGGGTGGCTLSATIQVEAATAARSLAFTGSSSSIPTLWVGAGLVALGAGLVFVARRRLSGAAR
jgi:LPXTG-motif cell wall-anchored protein